MLARVLVIAVALASLPGCDKTTHDNLDKWMRTERGPDKLKHAFADEGLDVELSAHAGANLVKKGMDPDVLTALEAMSAPRRVSVLALLAPRLWDLARVQGEMTMPGPQQVAAKDALVAVRTFGDDKVKATIDGYLLDWYTSGYYEGRATLGANLGAYVIRMLGPQAAPKLIEDANAEIAAPVQGTKHVKIGDEILVGLGASCSPDAVKKLIEIAHMDRGDSTLAIRAVSGIYKGYIDSGAMFDVCDPAALKPSLDALIALARDENSPHEVTNDAVDLIRVSGAPECIAPLVSMVAAPHHDVQYRYVGAAAALRCGGVKAITEVVRALPDGPYEHTAMAGAVWGEIVRLTPRDKVLDALRGLLADKGRMSRWIAIEGLAALKSTDDAARIAALAHDNAKLVGFWGGPDGPDPTKPDPTLGQRATELAAQLK